VLLRCVVVVALHLTASDCISMGVFVWWKCGRNCQETSISTIL